MTINERVAYLKGLAEGLSLDLETKEGKLISAIIEVLDEVAMEMSELEDGLGELSEHVDLIDEDLDALEEDYYGDECCCEDDEDEYDEDDDEGEGHYYEVTCPSCGDNITLDEKMIEKGAMACPGCGERLEFDLEDPDKDEE
jgi:DNA-directed RNA polymerase subunit RPC12/RpoP